VIVEYNADENACNVGRELNTEELLDYLEKQKNSFQKLKILESIINSSPFIALSRDIQRDFSITFISENISRFGYKAEDFGCRMAYEDIIKPDEREYVKLELIENCNEGSKCLTLKYNIMTKNGELKPVEEKTYIHRDLQGNPKYLYSIVFER
jgi:PAS domain S-box-containing protein